MAEKASMKAKEEFMKIPLEIFAARYEDYPENFSKKWFSRDCIVETVKRLIGRGFTRDNLRWGYYQKYAAPDMEDMQAWGGEPYFKLWEASIDEAREALAKIPVDTRRPGPDPDQPGVLAKNMLEHLDTAVRIAIFDKHLAGNPYDSGIEIDVIVRPQGKKSRRHKVTTEWRVASGDYDDPKYKHDRLSISMTCPLGGWIGTALWRYGGPAHFTRFVATYEVPDEPEDARDQIIFVFNGLESLPAPGQPVPPAILQPVLQWTKATGWAIRSWYVPATYTPTIDMMPAAGDQRQFTTPYAPAWTEAKAFDQKEPLTGVIEWDGMYYRCWFEVGQDKTKVVELEARGILPLTYPVAVIEAYGFTPKCPDELVKEVTMRDIALERSDLPGRKVEPKWTVGTDDPPTPKSGKPILFGTGRLQRYCVRACDNGATLTFKRKP